MPVIPPQAMPKNHFNRIFIIVYNCIQVMFVGAADDTARRWAGTIEQLIYYKTICINKKYFL